MNSGKKGHNTIQRNLLIIQCGCWKCKLPMQIAVCECPDEDYDYCGPDEFTNEELIFAREMGLLIEEHFSKTAEYSYLANTCQSCGAFTGNFELFAEYIQPALIGELNFSRHTVTSTIV